MKLVTSILAASIAQTAIAAPINHSHPLYKRFDINDLIRKVLDIFPADIVVNDLQDTITSGLQDLANDLDVNTSEDMGAACADITILFARGTDEPGTVGVLVGPAFFQAVQDQSGRSVAVQGTANYAANIDGYLAGGDNVGTNQLASDIQSTISRCPSTKLVVSGYSQGGQLVHKAADIVGSSGMTPISSVVIFGDPLSDTPVTGAASKTKVLCHFGDNICDGGDLVLPMHLTYAVDAHDAAAFVVTQAGF